MIVFFDGHSACSVHIDVYNETITSRKDFLLLKTVKYYSKLNPFYCQILNFSSFFLTILILAYCKMKVQ